MYDAFSVVGKKLEPERTCTVCTCGEESKHLIEDMMNLVLLFTWMKFLELWRSQKRLARCCACTCGKRPKHFIEDMNFETRQGCATCPPSNRTKRGSHANYQTWGALVCIDHFQVFCKDYPHPWNTNPGWFPPRQEWWPRGPWKSPDVMVRVSFWFPCWCLDIVQIDKNPLICSFHISIWGSLVHFWVGLAHLIPLAATGLAVCETIAVLQSI